MSLPLPNEERLLPEWGRLTELVLTNVRRAFPNVNSLGWPKPGTVAKHPKDVFPVFYGCLDWHSAVHSHWFLLVARSCLTLAPELTRRIDEHFREVFTAGNLDAESAVLKDNPYFERTYGWAWFLKLAATVLRAPGPETEAVHRMGQSLFDAATAFIGRLVYPIHVGTHQNTAFTALLALDYLDACHDAGKPPSLVAAPCSCGSGSVAPCATPRCKAWWRVQFVRLYGDAQDAPALPPGLAMRQLEPSGTDFLSPFWARLALQVRLFGPDVPYVRLLRTMEDAAWAAYCPVKPGDPADGHLVHLTGLNLSRAYCMALVGRALPEDDPLRSRLLEKWRAHWETSFWDISGGTFMGTHWLPSFALLAFSWA